jgi:hypothetical protein
MKIYRCFLLVSVLVASSTQPAIAQYTLILKNGGQIAVQNYREEGQMIKFYGLGGEIGLSKDQIQSIRRAGEGEHRSLSLATPETTFPQTSETGKSTPDAAKLESRASSSPEQMPAEGAVQEDQELYNRLKETTEQLEVARQQYFNATQGGSSSANVSKEGLKAWAADLSSRIKDSQKAPDSEYTPKMKELSDLRKRVEKLQKERDALVEEIKRKNP